MAHGGPRPGAGRKPGSITRRTREIAEAMDADGIMTPLEFLTRVYADEDEEMGRRIDAAKAAAPYRHARLVAVEAKHEGAISLKGVGPLKLECRRES